MTVETTSSLLSDSVETCLDIVQQQLDAASWSHERDGENSIHCIAPTRWGELGGVFTMQNDPEALHFSVTLDVKPTANRRNEVAETVIQMNERLWLGHFDYWLQDGIILFRHTISLSGRQEPEAAEITSVIDAAREAIERFTPAVNYVIWAGKTADEALEAALFETIGEA